ncbi:glycosyltransferase family 2 protein [bacterium]|nr:glycosyltransferase family 2 protein [bacterium]
MKKSSISVCIVNYNNIEYLPDCLTSLSNQTIKDIKVIFIDNNSTDASVSYVEKNFPQFLIIKNKTNEYFCKAHNRGIKESGCEFHLVLNTDVILEHDFIEELLKAAQIDERIGILSGKIMRMDKKHIDTTGLFLGKDRCPIERGYGFEDHGQYEKPEFVFGAGGVAPLYRMEMLEDIEYENQFFDETYEIYYDDLDISWRANLKGWKGYYTPKAMAYHKRGGTNKVLPVKFKYFAKYDFAYLSDQNKMRLLRNRYLTIIKNDSTTNLLRDLPYILVYDIKIWSFIIFFAPKVIIELLRNLKVFSPALKFRKKIQHSKKIKNNIIRNWITEQI